MPRRREPDPLALRIGKRIRQFRHDAGLSLEKLAYESELGSKGHLSDVERGLTRPTVSTLKVLADRLGVALLDLVTFPEDDERQRLVEELRNLPAFEISELAKRYATSPGEEPRIPGEEALRLVVGERPKDRSAEVYRELGRRIQRARKDAGRSLEMAASRAGIEVAAYQKLEEGSTDVSIQTLIRIAEALGISFWGLVAP